MWAKTKGATLFGILWVVILIVFGAYLCAKLIPPYYHNYLIKDALKALAKEPQVEYMNHERLRQALVNKIIVNYLPASDADKIDLTEEAKKYYLDLNYEVRVHVIANLDAVMMFNNRVMVESEENS